MPLDAGPLDADISEYLTKMEQGQPVDAIYTGEMLVLVQVLREVRRLREEVAALRQVRPSEESPLDVADTIKKLNNMEK